MPGHGRGGEVHEHLVAHRGRQHQVGAERLRGPAQDVRGVRALEVAARLLGELLEVGGDHERVTSPTNRSPNARVHERHSHSPCFSPAGHRSSLAQNGQ